MLAPVPLSWLVLVRTFMHWATTALPLLVATPFLGELLHLPRDQLPVLLASLALGTPLLSLLGAVVAALTVGMRRSGILVALLALPLYVPVLVFGAGSVAAAAQGLIPSARCCCSAPAWSLALVLAPLAAAAAHPHCLELTPHESARPLVPPTRLAALLRPLRRALGAVGLRARRCW